MNVIVKDELEHALKNYTGDYYIHFEVIPGGFVRNLQAKVEQTYISGENPFRIALKLAQDGWIRIEDLTYYEIDSQGRLILSGHDEQGRITTTLLLSKTAFPK